jgi:class 3 adenylate cyclase
MDLGGWLRNLGLDRYEADFRDNGIDEQVLRHITAEDLREIGVATVGDRRKLLAAIAELAAAWPSAELRPPPSPAERAKTAELSAERRPITVMFCDLVGSTALASRLDAEDWRSLVGAYLDDASAAVTGLGGHVLKRLGDGLMALFGYPQAQENDAERAVRAALAIQRALAEINAKNASKGAPELLARIGLESGPVVVDATGEVFGDAPNVAARVQAAAEPASVLITMNVQRQVAGLFVVEDRGAHALKGALEPTTLFRVVRASGGRRFGARALTPLVGREEELDLLRRRWERVVKGEGQLVLVVGEPGIGKSRLVEEFRLKLGETPHTFVEWSSSQLLQNTPLHPVAEWGRQRFGADEPAARRFADLENTLRLIGLDASEYAPLLAPLVDIPLPEERAAKLAPEELRRRQLAALIAWYLAGARTQPAVLAFEDLHWADPTSLDLLQALAERGRTAPLFIIPTARPEFRPPWSLRSHHSVISLSPLDRADVAQMVGELGARHALSQEVIDGVSERTGGVPLFVEEVTRLLLERGEEGGAHAIPPTLRQSLAARLDRLDEAREVAQIGAVLGRDFTYSLLAAVAAVDDRGYGDAALQSALDRLAGADLLIAEGSGLEANYRFKHALIQDAAYDSLLRSRRQALHRRAAELLRDSAESAAAAPEVIAHHFTEAGLEDLAIEWWGRAGDKALRRSAFQEAIAHLDRAIAMADKAAGGAKEQAAGGAVASSRRLKLQTDYGQAVMWSRGFASEETKAAFARAAELAAKTDDFAARFATAHSQWALAMVRGDQQRVRELASLFLKEAEDAGRLVEVGVARRGLAQACYLSGEFIEARTHCERALDVCDLEREKETRERFTDDTRPIATSLLAMTMWQLGEVEHARALINEANRHASGLGHAPSMAHPLNWKSRLEILRGDAAAALSAAETLQALCREHGMPFWRVKAELDVGCARGRLHDAAAGAEDLRRALAAAADQGMMWDAWFYTALLAELEAKALGMDIALERIDEALALAHRVDNRCDLAFLYVLRGKLMLERDPSNPAPVEEAFQTALKIAKQQGARSWGLRAALSLAELYQLTARPVDAHAVLAPALEGFAPTPEMPEIAEGQALLAALAETAEVKGAEAQRQRRLHLQTAYGQAVMWSKGFAAEETKAAFARAAELAAKSDDFSERFAAAHGQWTMARVRGELRPARELTSAFLREAEEAGRVMEAGVARRSLALISYLNGDFVEARTHCERALAASDPEHEEQARERYGEYTGTVATACLALTNWQLGAVERARELIEIANRRATELGHPPSMAGQLFQRCNLEILRGDAGAALSAAESLEALSREHGLALFRLWAELTTAWARGRLHDPAAAAAELRQALANLTDQGLMLAVPLFYALLAELEAETFGAERALARIDEALALAHQLEQRSELAFFHRLRGEILLKHDPANAEPAEEAFRAAIAIAKQQGARSFELLASLSLAKFYQSTGRLAEAHAVLAPALEGFSPTPEMPEIAEAQAVLATLAGTEEVRVEAARRERRLHLQTAYGQAMMMAKGYAAEETRAAFARAAELAWTTHDFSERSAGLIGQLGAACTAGELRSARELALTLSREAGGAGRIAEARRANFWLGLIAFWRGDFVEARTRCEQAIVDAQDANADRKVRERFNDPHTSALPLFAATMWQLGEVERARELIELAIRGRSEAGTVEEVAHTLFWNSYLEIWRGDPGATLKAAEALAHVAQEHGTMQYLNEAELHLGWARGRIDDPMAGAAQVRRVLAAFVDQGVKVNLGFYSGLLAQLEAETLGAESALVRVDEALRLSNAVEHSCSLPFLHRLRGEFLLKRDPVDPAPAEEAFQTSISIAKEQGACSPVLLASLAVAKLYHSTGRPAEARAVLAPALEGFKPTLEMPEIAEARALLARLA